MVQKLSRKFFSVFSIFFGIAFLISFSAQSLYPFRNKPFQNIMADKDPAGEQLTNYKKSQKVRII